MAVSIPSVVLHSLLVTALLPSGVAVPAQPNQGNQVAGDLGERRWDRPMAERFESMVRRIEALRLAGKCEEFYRARGGLSIALANAEHSIRDTAKFNPPVTGAMWDTHRYYTGYYNQLMGLECPPRAAVAETAPEDALTEPGTGSGAGPSQENSSQSAADQQRREKATAAQGNEGAGAGEQPRAPWPSKHDPSDLNAKNSETAVDQLEMTNSGVEACVDSKEQANCDKPEPRRPKPKPKPKRREGPETR